MERMRELSGIFVTRALIPFMGDAPSGPIHLPKGPSSKTLTVGVRFQCISFGEGLANIHSIVDAQLGCV